MKARLHIVFLLWMLMVGFLFSQIGAGFFHNKHDAHKNTVVLPAGKFAVQTHGEHCKLCAIDLIHLYAEPLCSCDVQEATNVIFLTAVHVSHSTPHFDLKGRSPPFII